ncbi:hypothetical protein SBDP1_970007 [Syntrophobacter sp. SbD1]|nr:hypothetical protein SBDP1_970007 [Syntrophobacter sp. SbD1]
MVSYLQVPGYFFSVRPQTLVKDLVEIHHPIWLLCQKGNFMDGKAYYLELRAKIFKASGIRAGSKWLKPSLTVNGAYANFRRWSDRPSQRFPSI